MKRPNDRQRVDPADRGGRARSPVDDRRLRLFGRRSTRPGAGVSWRLLVVSALLAGSVAAPSGPAAAEDRFSATWTYVEGEEPQGVFVGNELYLPPCVPDTARAATAQAGVIKFVMCPDHLQIESVATSSDITFYPAFSPDRHTYVVHVADSVSEVRFDPIFRSQFPWQEARLRPGFAYSMVDGNSATNNYGRQRSVSVKLSPGVTTVEIGANHWFMRYGASQTEYNRRNNASWWRDSGKLARTRYSLQLVWKSPDTPLVAPVELTPIGTVDYDTDDDGLIEVSSLAQLEAVRWDANGDGYSDHGGPLHVGFPNAVAQMGCPSSGCVGYELAGDLDFDTNASGDADEGDDFWNSGHGWVPIGADTDHYSAVFEGNGHTISNLFINSDDVTVSAATGYQRVDRWDRYVGMRSIHLGLFEELARGGVIRNVGLADVSVTRTFPCLNSAHGLAGDLCADGRVGALVGVSAGTIRGSWVTGTVSNTVTQGTKLNKDLPAVVGGLVGQAHSSSVIAASFASADVSADMDPWNGGPGNRVGGLVGINGGAITASYATGTAQSGVTYGRNLSRYPKFFVGGLVAHNSGSITASYVSNTVSGGVNHPLVGRTAGASRVSESYWDAGESYGWHSYSKGTGKSTAELQAPTDYTGIYANWNVDLDGDGNADDPWSFGTASDYPTLTGVGPGSNQQQLKTATYSVSADASAVEGKSASLTVTLSEAAPKGGVQFAVSAGFGGSASVGDVGTITSPVTASEGDTTVEVSIPTVADAIDEDDETFTVTVTALTDGWAAADGQNTATVTIIDDDTAAVTVTAADPISIDEGATATYTVVLASQPTADVTVAATSGDAAVSVSPASHTFTTANWSAAATFTVTALGDDDTDDHTVTVSHQITTTDPKYATAAAASVTVAVTDTTPANQAPTVASPIADIDDLAVGDTREVSLAGVFDDADSDPLAITAESSNNAVATVSAAIDGTTNAVTAITVIAAAEGTVTITVTARDTAGNQVSDAFDVTVAAAAAVAEQQQADPELPGPVTALELTATHNSVTVSWQPPEVGEAPTRYIVHLRPEGGKTGSGKTKNPKAKKTQVVFKKLKPGVTYNVWVRAQNQAGKGDRVNDTITLPED